MIGFNLLLANLFAVAGRFKYCFPTLVMVVNGIKRKMTFGPNLETMGL